MFKRYFKSVVFAIPILKRFYLKKRMNQGALIAHDDLQAYLDTADLVFLHEEAKSDDLFVGLIKDGKEPDNYTYSRFYYPKYRRFLINNQIKFDYYEIHKRDWIEQAAKFDVIVWHMNSDPISQDIALNKIYILEKVLGKKCLPSFDEIWSYENKINAQYLYEAHVLPSIATFLTFDQEEAEQYIANCAYPIIAKSRTASASAGVYKVKDHKSAKKLLDKIFSDKGMSTNYFHDRQKNYVYFQQFISDATYDLRIITIGNKAFGYYRFPKKGDFRASGSGILEKKAIPAEALDLAFKVKRAFGSTCLATDLLFSEKANSYYIIETSIFIGVDSPRQLEVDGVPGFYRRISEGNYVFEQGKFWIQELALKELLETK